MGNLAPGDLLGLLQQLGFPAAGGGPAPPAAAGQAPTGQVPPEIQQQIDILAQPAQPPLLPVPQPVHPYQYALAALGDALQLYALKRASQGRPGPHGIRYPARGVATAPTLALPGLLGRKKQISTVEAENARRTGNATAEAEREAAKVVLPVLMRQWADKMDQEEAFRKEQLTARAQVGPEASATPSREALADLVFTRTGERRAAAKTEKTAEELADEARAEARAKKSHQVQRSEELADQAKREAAATAKEDKRTTEQRAKSVAAVAAGIKSSKRGLIIRLNAMRQTGRMTSDALATLLEAGRAGIEGEIAAHQLDPEGRAAAMQSFDDEITTLIEAEMAKLTGPSK